MADWRCEGLVSGSKFHVSSSPELNLKLETLDLELIRTEIRPANFTGRWGENIRGRFGFLGWLGTDLRIVTQGRSCTSKVVLLDGGNKSAASDESCRLLRMILSRL